MKKAVSFIPFAILVIMELLTIEPIYKSMGMDIIDAGYLGINNVFLLFPIMFCIYGICCAKYKDIPKSSIIMTFILFIIIVVTFYMEFIEWTLCLISIPIFLGAFFLTKLAGKTL